MANSFPRTRGEAELLPASWYQAIEKARTKARHLVKQIVAIDQSTSVVVGELTAVDIDMLWRPRYPYCRLTLRRPIRYKLDGKFECNLGELEFFFVSKAQMIMKMNELASRFPAIYEEAIRKIKVRW
jgi:hypothetical protein